MSTGSHNVYLIISKKKGFYKTYVGYAKNIKNRLNQHNSNKGAKSTRGFKWGLIYKKKFITKKQLMYTINCIKNFYWIFFTAYHIYCRFKQARY